MGFVLRNSAAEVSIYKGESLWNMENVTTVYLIRHGECAGNIDGRMRGRKDFPLNQNGIAQAKALALALKDKGIKFIYSSPLLRATVTADIIGNELGVTYETCEGFNNMKLGPWEGELKSNLAAKYPEQWKEWLVSPENLRIADAETIDDVKERALSAMKALIAQHDGSTMAVISHRGVLKPLLAGAVGVAKPYFWRLHVDNASFSKLVFRPSRGFTLMSLNYTEHLRGLPMVQEYE
jgi:broad specificity phosphatase PhoE